MSWSRPALEELSNEKLIAALEAASAEVRRRGMVLEEQHQERLRALRIEIAAESSHDRAAELQRRERLVAAREFDLQHAEAMAVVWMERADAIRGLRLEDEVPPEPVDWGQVLDGIIESYRYRASARDSRWPVGIIPQKIEEAAKLRGRPIVSGIPAWVPMGPPELYEGTLPIGNDETPGVTPGSDADHGHLTDGLI